MRLKYYLRGLGIGIIFAVIIMMIGFHDNKQSMSDTEIIEKAKTLGMVEAKNISDVYQRQLLKGYGRYNGL